LKKPYSFHPAVRFRYFNYPIDQHALPLAGNGIISCQGYGYKACPSKLQFTSHLPPSGSDAFDLIALSLFFLPCFFVVLLAEAQKQRPDMETICNRNPKMALLLFCRRYDTEAEL